MTDHQTSAIEPIPLDQLPSELKSRLEARARKVGYLSEFFSRTAHAPAVLASFIDFAETLKAALPIADNEVVALRVTHLCGNDYEANQHQRLCRAHGFTDGWILAATFGDLDQLSPEEQCLSAMASAFLAPDHDEDAMAAAFEDCVRLVGAERAIAAAFLIGRFVMQSMVVRALRLPPPVPSIFEHA